MGVTENRGEKAIRRAQSPPCVVTMQESTSTKKSTPRYRKVSDGTEVDRTLFETHNEVHQMKHATLTGTNR